MSPISIEGSIMSSICVISTYIKIMHPCLFFIPKLGVSENSPLKARPLHVQPQGTHLTSQAQAQSLAYHQALTG